MLAHSVRIAQLVKKAVKPEEGKIDEKYNNVKKEQVKEVDPEVALRKEIRQAVGQIDPRIKAGVEDTLAKTKYRRKTKFEAMDNVVEDLNQKVLALQSKTFALTENKSKIPEKNPLLDLFQPPKEDDAESEAPLDRLEEREIVDAFRQKDMSKVEFILLKSKIRLQEYDDKVKALRPEVEEPALSEFGSSTVSFKLRNSEVSGLYDKAKNRSVANSSTASSPYKSTSASQNFGSDSPSKYFSPTKSVTFGSNKSHVISPAKSYMQSPTRSAF